MKRILCLVLLLLVLFCGCETTTQPPAFHTEPSTGQPTAPPADPPTQPPVQRDDPSLQLLQTLWAAFPENHRFPCAGGDWENFVDGAPGAARVDPEILSGMLLIPEQQVEKLSHAATLLHGLNANTFTCGALKLQNADLHEFTRSIKDSIQNNQWVCGFPDMLLIATVDDALVLSAFGKNTLINALKDTLLDQYPNAQIRYCEGISP